MDASSRDVNCTYYVVLAKTSRRLSSRTKCRFAFTSRLVSSIILNLRPKYNHCALHLFARGSQKCFNRSSVGLLSK